MRYVPILALAGVLLMPASAVAETCSGYYRMCVSVCNVSYSTSKTCLGECPGFKKKCMQTGTWVSRKVQDYKVERR